MVDLPAVRMGADCRRCPLADLQCGPVMAHGPKTARLVVVRDCPSKRAIASGSIIDDEVGRMILEDAPGAFVTTAHMCGPPIGWRTIDDWTKEHRAICKVASPSIRCRERLRKEVSNAEAIVTLGPIAFKSIAEVFGVRIGRVLSRSDRTTLSSLESQRGHPFRLPTGQILMPALSIDSCLAVRRHLVHVTRDDLSRTARLVKIGAW